MDGMRINNLFQFSFYFIATTQDRNQNFHIKLGVLFELI